MNIHKKFFSKIGFNYLIFGLLALIFQIILVNILGFYDDKLLGNVDVLSILSGICNYILPLPIFIYLMRKIESKTLEKENINFKKFIIYIAISLTLMWIGNIAGLLITSLLSAATHSDISNPVVELINSSNIILNLLLISIIGPVFEELLFRKILIDRTIKYGAKVSIILSALLFAFFHGNINQFFYAFLIGGFFAYVYIKTGKIKYSIALHIILNLMGSVVSLFVGEAGQAIAQNSFNMFDLGIVLIYFIVIIIAFLIGIYELVNYKKAKFNGAKTEIYLKNPLKTVILNPGMIFFMIFFICEIIYQLL